MSLQLPYLVKVRDGHTMCAFTTVVYGCMPPCGHIWTQHKDLLCVNSIDIIIHVYTFKKFKCFIMFTFMALNCTHGMGSTLYVLNSEADLIQAPIVGTP